MIRRPRREDGRADVAALALSVVLGAAALAPALLLRSHPGWAKCRDEALAEPSGGTAAPGGGSVPVDPIPRALAAADAVRSQAAASAFRPDPGRVLRPVTGAAEAVRVSELDGRVVDGRLTLQWRPAPGSRGTQIRVEGLGGPEAHEEEVPAAQTSRDLPVPASAGTIVARATPIGHSGPAAESRVSIPFRVPVEVVRAESADDASGSAILLLRRPYDGRVVEAEFPVHLTDEVGSLSAAWPGGPTVDFRTDFVLGEIRPTPGARTEVLVPRFDAEGRVVRDEAGRPILRPRAGRCGKGWEVVLRGPDDERKSVPVR